MDERFSRRRFIMSAGTAVTLPMLPSLLYSRNARAASCAPVKRFLAYHFPNGHHMPEHQPTGVGSGAAWKLPPMLSVMEDLKSELVFVSGLENQQRRREVGDHAIGCGALLTARKPTAKVQVSNTSVDQIIADQQKGCRALASWQLGTQDAGPTDTFGSFYTRSISWRGAAVANADGTMSFPAGPATPLGKQIDAVKAFDRLFQGADPAASAADAAMRRALRKSVLDSINAQGVALQNRLNAEDRIKVDQLFTGIRSLEQDIDSTASTNATCMKPVRPPTLLEFQKQLDVMHDLMAVAFQCDITRVITFMMGDPINNRNMAFIPAVAAIGGEAADHAVSHHSNQPDLVNKFRAMVAWKMLQIAGFLRKLKALQDFDGQPLLNNALIWISSELADGNRHNHDNKPILLAGRLGGLVVPDRHAAFPTSNDYTKVKSYGDFFITLLSLYDVNVTAFGDDGKEAIQWQR